MKATNQVHDVRITRVKTGSKCKSECKSSLWLFSHAKPQTGSHRKLASGFSRLSSLFLAPIRIGSVIAGYVRRTRRPGQPPPFQGGDGVADRAPVTAASYLSAMKGDARREQKRIAWLRRCSTDPTCLPQGKRSLSPKVQQVIHPLSILPSFLALNLHSHETD